VYIGGPAGSGAPGFATTANTPRGDVEAAYEITGNHGFVFPIPAQYHDGVAHSVYVYAIDAQGLHNPLLDGRSYSFVLGTPSEPECLSGFYCECTNSCTSVYTCQRVCGM